MVHIMVVPLRQVALVPKAVSPVFNGMSIVTPHFRDNGRSEPSAIPRQKGSRYLHAYTARPG